MTIWKKAISAVTSAALLASLLATSALAVPAYGTLPSYQTTKLLACTNAAVSGTAGCSQVADGISTVTLTGTDATTGTSSSYVTVTGASFVTATAPFVPVSSTVVTAPGSVNNGTIVLRAPAAVGTATVSYYLIASGSGIATLEGTLTVTFTATSGLDVSTANSVVTTRQAPCALATDGKSFTGSVYSVAPATANPAAYLCILLRDGNGSPVDTAAGKVGATITPYGLVGGAQTTTTETGANGVAQLTLSGSGLAGASTIGVTVTIGTVVTTFAPVSFTFAGAVSKITLASVSTVGAVSNHVDDAITYIAEDDKGNRLDLSAGTFTYTYSTGAPFTVSTGGNLATSPTVKGLLDAHCGATVGTGTVSVKSGSVVSNAVTFNCSNPVQTYSVAFSADSVVPGGQATITVSVKDKGGRPAPDGTKVTILVSAGATISDMSVGTATEAESENGEATWTYLAPFNAGVVTVLAYVYATAENKPNYPITTATPQSDSIIVGKPVAPATLGSTASVLGVSTGRGAWSTSTKVAKVGEFITWRFAAGVANANKTIGVFLQTKDANGVWSAPVRFSARVADSQGNAYFSWKGTKAMWVSIRGGLDDARSTPPVQGRWQ